MVSVGCISKICILYPIQIPGEASVNYSTSGNENDPFGGDDEDDFFSQVHMPSPPAR